MNSYSKILQYLKECYKADNRGSIITNIYDTKYESRVFLEDETLMNNLEESREIEYVTASEIHKKSFLYRKEKDLIYCSTFLVGTLKNSDGTFQKICSPLFIYPAELDINNNNKNAILKIDKNSIQVNFGLISIINDDNDYVIKLYDIINNEISKKKNALNRDDILEIIDFIDNDNITIDQKAFTLFPILVQNNTLSYETKRLNNKNPQNFKLLNCSILMLANKSKIARGVIDEIATISGSPKLSDPLINIFSNKYINNNSTGNNNVGHTPSILSNAQKKILKSCKENPLTLVIGPPGTGKSYSIASIAIEHLSRGESVLIASKMDHAVDVIGNKIEEILGSKDSIVRGGDSQYLKKLKDYLKKLLHGMYSNFNDPDLSEENINKILKNLSSQIIDNEKRYKKIIKKEKSWGEFLYNIKIGLKKIIFFNKLRYNYIKNKKTNPFFLSNLTDSIEVLISTKQKFIKELIKEKNNTRINNTITNNRNELIKFDKAIRSRTGGRQEEIFNKLDFSNLLEAFPVWLVNLSDIYNVLPLKENLFDLAIIDEATQCDITSCIPILQRAKRAVIVGDPNQLRHISFLSKYRQSVIGSEFNLNNKDIEEFNFREKSILDMVSEKTSLKNKVFFLDEHFRSLPNIIEFSNKEFYNRSLKIMTETPNNSSENPMELIICKGIKNKSGVNEIEADLIIKKISEIIKYEKELTKNASRSIGVLSPFRDQVDYIYKLIMKKFSLEVLEKHNILAGTAHTFQGEEKDIMFLSFTIDNESHRNNHYFISKEDILNVSITRARIKQYIYISINPKKINEKLLIRKYLEYVQSLKNTNTNKLTINVHDNFLKDVIKSLKPYNIKVFPAYNIAGLNIDLVIEYNNKTFGIDLIGYPGEFFESFSLERYKMYYRAGLKIFPLAYSKWVFDKDNCIEKIKEKIEYIQV